jgi:hypothetical protein
MWHGTCYIMQCVEISMWSLPMEPILEWACKPPCLKVHQTTALLDHPLEVLLCVQGIRSLPSYTKDWK